MGLFDALTAPKPQTNIFTPATEADAWFGLFRLAMEVDNDTHSIENTVLASFVRAKRIFSSVSDFELLYNYSMDMIDQYGESAYLDGCVNKITEEYKPTVLTLCVELVLSDGKVTTEERGLLNKLAQKMNVSDELVAKIIEIGLIRQKGNIS